MLKTFRKNLKVGAVTGGLALALMAGSVHAQMTSGPMRSAQRASLTNAEIELAMAMSTPMEILATSASIGGPEGGVQTGIGQSTGMPQVSGAGMGWRDPSAARSGRTFSRGEWRELREEMSGTGADAQSGVAPQNYGSGNFNTIYHYNDYRLWPSPVRINPMRQAGYYLFQAADGLWYHCTAALINRAIILTAGHCVHDGGGTQSGWNMDGYFFPGYSVSRSQTNQFFGRCRVDQMTTTTGWYNNGLIQQGYDVAMAACGATEFASRTWLNGRLPGRNVGWFGFCYANCTSGYQFMTQIGYPGNYYSGGQMVLSQHIEETALSGGPDFQYGTGMRGGSSGGPHVVNIGYLQDSATDLGQYTARNRIFAVTSWGYISEAFKIQGSSPISGPSNSNNATAMFNLMCARSRTLHGASSCTDI